MFWADILMIDFGNYHQLAKYFDVLRVLNIHIHVK